MREKLTTLSKYKEHLFGSSKNPYLKETNLKELKAFIRLLYCRGLYRHNHYSLKNLFSTERGPPIYSATISQNIIAFLLANISFDNKEERVARWPADRFAETKPMFQIFNTNLPKFLTPSLYLSLDETLYRMRHQTAFHQYNPAKPHRYGLFVKSLNNASFPYTYKTTLYAGKPVNGDGPYYLDTVETYVKYLVNQTETDASLKRRHISMDRLYNSISLANWLLEKNITCVGTLNNNRVGIPVEIKDVKNRGELLHCILKRIIKTLLCVRTQSKQSHLEQSDFTFIHYATTSWYSKR